MVPVADLHGVRLAGAHMSSTHGPAPAESALPADPSSGPVALLAALESVRAAIYCLRGPVGEPVWANARARAQGTTRADLPVLEGRAVGDLVDEVLASGRSQTVSGTTDAGRPLTAYVRPVRLGGDPGVVLVLESADRDGEPPVWEHLGQVVEQVQNSLLPPFLPMLPELQLSGSYHQASSVHAAGGDWYDAVPLGRGRVALVIGDAVGHGIPAAGAMSRLRGAMRSSALRDPSPAAVLAALDAFADQMDDVEGASVFYGVLDATSGRLTYAAAAHPAPLVIGADGVARFLPVTPRPPLGSVPGSVSEVSDEVLELGATLVLYSDGALVGAGEGVDGRDQLVEVATRVVGDDELRGENASMIASSIASGVHDVGARPDDLAVLAAFRCPEPVKPLRLELRAVPASLPLVRRQVGAWLTALGMGEQDRVGLMVAVGEACSNAAEHAYRGVEPGSMEVAGDVDADGMLTLVVRDHGTWRPPDRDPGDRGRGLLIMRQLVDRVLLRGQDGTVVTLSMQLRQGPEVEEDRIPADAAASVVVDREGERPLVRVAGVVDVVSAEVLRIRLLEASRGGTTPVDLDLTDVTLFSSAAVRVLLAVARIARDEGWRPVVTAPEGGVTYHILEISGLGGLVELL